MYIIKKFSKLCGKWQSVSISLTKDLKNPHLPVYLISATCKLKVASHCFPQYHHPAAVRQQALPFL